MEEGGAAMTWQRLIGELNQGIELTRVLETHLDYASPLEFQRLLIRSLLSTLVKAVTIASTLPAAAPPPGENHGGDAHARASKKRKVVEPELTRWVRVTSSADGFSWRKYGQKDILESKYPRAYYRCSHYKTRGCPATKHMQRSDENHFDVVYRGAHTCGTDAATGKAAPPITPAEWENSLPGTKRQLNILDFGSGLAANNEVLDSGDFPAKNNVNGVDLEEPIIDLVNGQCFSDDFDLDFLNFIHSSEVNFTS